MSVSEEFLREEVRAGYRVSAAMKKVWAVEMEILEYFDRLCKKHGLRYFMDYGTLLGAVRHQGFIPWDDDIDVAMFRSDYERLKEIAPREVKEPFFYQNSYTDGFISAFSKIRDSRTSAIEFPEAVSYIHQGIYIDIFPLDDVPDKNAMKENIQEIELEVWNTVSNPDGIRRWIKEGNKTALTYDIIEELLRLPVRERFMQFEAFMAQHSGKSAYVNFFTDDIGQVSAPKKRSWYRDVVDLPFEHLTLPAPVDYDLVLRAEYGDYWRPVQNGSAHEGAFFDPETPYLQYGNG